MPFFWKSRDAGCSASTAGNPARRCARGDALDLDWGGWDQNQTPHDCRNGEDGFLCCCTALVLLEGKGSGWCAGLRAAGGGPRGRDLPGAELATAAAGSRLCGLDFWPASAFHADAVCR